MAGAVLIFLRCPAKLELIFRLNTTIIFEVIKRRILLGKRNICTPSIRLVQLIHQKKMTE